MILEISELSARKEADDKLKELETREQKVVSQEKELADRQKHQRTEVNKKVEKKLEKKERELLFSYNRYESSLETKNRILETKYMAGFILTLVYGIVVTLIQMFKSDVFKTDLVDFGKKIVNTGAWVTCQFIDVIDMIYGMYIGGLIIVPDFVALVGTQDTFHVFEIPVPVADYSQSFIPVILGVWIMSYIVKFLKKYVPKAVSALVVPTVTVLLMTVIMFAVCAPIGSYIGKIIGNVFIWLYESNQIVRVIAFIGMAVIQPYLVISGMHMVLINFAIMNYMEVGYDAFVMVVGCGCSFGIAFGAFLRFKKKENKAMALGNVASGVLAGVTEPILYGIILRYKKAPLALGIVCVIVGVFCGIFTPKQYVIGGFNNVFATAAAFTGGSVMNIVLGIVMCAAAFVLGTIASCLIVDYKED